MATLIGHGRLGAGTALRDFVDLVDESDHQKDMAIEIRPVKEIKGWTLESGTTYVSPYEQFFDNRRLDAVGVRTLLDTGLVRVETLDLCKATPGTFFYDVDTEFADINGLMITQWDIVGAFWDIGGSDVKWDQFPRLFIHLFDSSDPNLTTVVVNSGFFYSTREMVQPDLGPRKENNGGFENWTDGELDDWIMAGTEIEFWDDTVTDWDQANVNWDPVLDIITQETSVVRSGNSAVKMEVTGTQLAVLQQDMENFVVGKHYRVSGYYNVDHASGVGALQISDQAGTSFITADGRSTAGTNQSTFVTSTAGKYRRFIFDFRAHSTTLKFWLVAAGVGAGAKVYWDDFSVQRIWRFNRYEPRVSAGSVPRAQSGSQDIFFGGKRIGSGGVTLINSDGQLERLIAQFEWMNQEVIISSGGSFNDGQEIHIEDYRNTFKGLIQKITVNDDECEFDLQDIRAFFHRTLPTRVYDDVEFPNMNTKKSLGRVRPIFFGVKENIDPVRINVTANGFGIYEVCDAEISPNGMKAIDAVYAYADETSAGTTKNRSAIGTSVQYRFLNGS